MSFDFFNPQPWIHIIGIISGTILIYLSICIILVNQTFPTEESNVLTSINMNLNSNIFEDIIVISEGSCPFDYNLLKLGDWPGITSGCLLRGNIAKKCDKIYYRVSGSNYSYNIGKEISSVPAEPIFNIKGYKFCAKYILDPVWKVSTSCPNDYRRCSPSLCVRKTQKCPITNIEIFTNRSNLISGDDNEFPFIDSKFIKISRKKFHEPITSLQLSFYGLPCYLYNRTSLPKYDLYPLVRNSHDCGPYGQDESTVILSALTEYEISESNDFQPYIEALPQYMDYMKNSQVFLVYKPRISLDSKQDLCFNTKSSFDESIKFWNSLPKFNAGLFSYCLFEGINLICWIVLFWVAYHGQELKAKDYSLWLVVLNVVSGVTLMIFWFGLRENAIKTKEMDSGFSLMKKYKCFSDDNYEEAIENFDQFLLNAPQEIIDYLNWFAIGTILKIVILYVLNQLYLKYSEQI